VTTLERVHNTSRSETKDALEERGEKATRGSGEAIRQHARSEQLNEGQGKSPRRILRTMLRRSGVAGSGESEARWWGLRIKRQKGLQAKREHLGGLGIKRGRENCLREETGANLPDPYQGVFFLSLVWISPLKQSYPSGGGEVIKGKWWCWGRFFASWGKGVPRNHNNRTFGKGTGSRAQDAQETIIVREFPSKTCCRL